MGGDGGVIAAKREYMQSCGDVFGMKGGMVKTALNRAETAELRTKRMEMPPLRDVIDLQGELLPSDAFVSTDEVVRFVTSDGDGCPSLVFLTNESLASQATKGSDYYFVCAISNERLREPVAACELGYLYNKDTLIAGLLNRDLNPAFNHIRGLKDIVECRLTPNPAYAEDRAVDGPEPAQFMCPVTLQEMNGSHGFVVLFSTGWVMAEKATKEVGIAGLQEEYGPFTEADIVRLAPTDNEREARKKDLVSKREKVRLAKKLKKSAKRDKAVAAAAGEGTSSPSVPSKAVAVASLSGSDGHEVATHVDKEGSGEASKSGKKRRRADKEASGRMGSGREASKGGAGASGDKSSSEVARAAAEAVKKNKEHSKSYASLFGKKDVSNEKLFIATAGHRYNLN